MDNSVMDFPLVVFVVFLVVLGLSVRTGAYFRRRVTNLEEDVREDLGVILAAALTLLGLIIGFTLSMAVTRYDQRKNYEEAEANAIGTEYLRVGFLPATDATRVRELLKSYLDQRVLFYTTRNTRQLAQINSATAQLQTDLWSVVQAAASTQPTPPVTLAAAGMNDVLNSQGYTQAAWWNRIPVPAWCLMAMVAISCNVLFGFQSRAPRGKTRRFFILPLIVSISFFLIADIDSPRRGIIRVYPQNLISLVPSLRAP
jgi:hypothetical protein